MEIHDDSESKDISYKIIKGDTEFKFNDVTNEQKTFGFHTATKNIQISMVLIKRVWKRRGKITKYVRKKRFKSQTKEKKGIKSEADNVENRISAIKKVKTFNPKEFTGDRQWCWNEFERHIGVPYRFDVSPFLAIAYIRAKKFQRFVPEANNLKKPVGTDSVFISSSKPKNKCFCPDHACSCIGDTVINKKKRIPKNYKAMWNLTRYIKILQVLFSRSANVNVNDFVKKMEEEMNKNAILGEDVCIRRCRHCLITETQQDIKYLPDFFTKVKNVEMPSSSDTEDEARLIEDIDDRICNVVYGTVSTQTDTLPNGQLFLGNFTHVLYSKGGETYLPDIRGNKLQITPYTHVSPKGPDMQVCAKKMEKLLDYKELKARISKFISSVYVIKDPGVPVRTNSTQVPWRKRICDTYDICPIKPPNRCDDEDYDNIPEVPWNFKMQEAISQETKKDESEEDDEDDLCPCCELFVGSEINKAALLQDMRNVLSLPGDVTISNNQLEKDQNISDVKIIIEEVVANTFDDMDENIQNKKSDLLKVNSVPQGKGNRKVKKMRNENIINMAKTDNEMEKNIISNENINYKESVNENISYTKEITENDNSKVNRLINAGKASDEINPEETADAKKRVNCDFLELKKPTLTSSSTAIKQKSSESLARNKNIKIINATDVEIYNSETHIENYNSEMEINHVLQKSDGQEKQELSKELSDTTKLNKKSSIKSSKILTREKVSSNIQNTSNKIVLQVNTSYKKASSAFSSLFKWLYGQSMQMSQFKKTLSAKSVSKDKYSIDDTHLNEKVSKSSEKEVFSIRYTSSTINVNKSTSSE